MEEGMMASNNRVVDLNLVEVQKKGAISLWQNWYDLGNFNEKVYSEVLEKLNKGEVPSIFHTLCRKADERLFLPNVQFDYIKKIPANTSTSAETVVEKIPIYIRLSTEAVQVGVARDTTIGTIQRDEEDDSYLKGFFCDENKYARVKVQEDSYTTWEFHETYTKAVTNLINTPAKMVGHNVEVTKLKSTFHQYSQSGKNLITRSLSRGVVADCFHGSRRCSNHAIVGNEGVGKSWTLIYALQQALLYENACVMFQFPKCGTRLVCIRKDNHIFVWIGNCSPYPSSFGCLSSNSNVLVLLDPEERGASYSEGRRRLLFVAYNDEKHFRQKPEKVTGDWCRILNPFSDDEIEVALPYMFAEQTSSRDGVALDKMLRYSKDIGNLLWYIKSKSLCAKRVAARRHFVNHVKWSYQHFIENICWFGFKSEKTPMMDTIFAIHAAGTSLDLVEAPMEVGYDGQLGVNYNKMIISVMVPSVKEHLLSSWREWILSYSIKHKEKYIKEIGIKVDDIFWMDLKRGGVIMNSWKMNKLGQKEKPVVAVIPSATCHTNVEIEELNEKVFNAAEHSVCRMVVGCPLIDFAGPGRQVYQVTVDGQCQLNYDCMKRLLIAGGLLEEDGNGVITSSNVTELQQRKIRFNWVVPVDICRSQIGQKLGTLQVLACIYYETVKSCFDKYVEQFVMAMDEKPKFTRKNRKRSFASQSNP